MSSPTASTVKASTEKAATEKAAAEKAAAEKAAAEKAGAEKAAAEKASTEKAAAEKANTEKAAAEKAAAEKAAAEKAEKERQENSGGGGSGEPPVEVTHTGLFDIPGLLKTYSLPESQGKQQFTADIEALVCWYFEKTFKPVTGIRETVSGVISGDPLAEQLTVQIGAGITANATLKTVQNEEGLYVRILVVSKFTRADTFAPCNPPLEIPIAWSDQANPDKWFDIKKYAHPKTQTGKAPVVAEPKDPSQMSDSFKKAFNDAWSKVPDSVKKRLAELGYNIQFGSYIKDNPWSSGLTSPNADRGGLIQIAENYKDSNGQWHRTVDTDNLFGTLMHEIGHAFDSADRYSSDTGFLQAWRQDNQALQNLPKDKRPLVDPNLYFFEGTDKTGKTGAFNNESKDGSTTKGAKETAAELYAAAALAKSSFAGQDAQANWVMNAYRNSLNYLVKQGAIK